MQDPNRCDIPLRPVLGMGHPTRALAPTSPCDHRSGPSVQPNPSGTGAPDYPPRLVCLLSHWVVCLSSVVSFTRRPKHMSASRTVAAMQRRARFDHPDAQVAGSVTQQVLKVLVANRLPEGRAGEQVLDPGAAEVKGEAGMQLITRQGRAGASIMSAGQDEEHRELAEQGDTGKGQRHFVSVASHVVGHLLPRLGFSHIPDPIRATRDKARRLKPPFVA
jgi:hypothetical protein